MPSWELRSLMSEKTPKCGFQGAGYKITEVTVELMAEYVGEY